MYDCKLLCQAEPMSLDEHRKSQRVQTLKATDASPATRFCIDRRLIPVSRVQAIPRIKVCLVASSCKSLG